MSVSLTVPWMMTFTSVPLLSETVAPTVLVRSRSFRIRTTPVVPFFTARLPLLQVPVTMYVPALLILTLLLESLITMVSALARSALSSSALFDVRVLVTISEGSLA